MLERQKDVNILIKGQSTIAIRLKTCVQAAVVVVSAAHWCFFIEPGAGSTISELHTAQHIPLFIEMPAGGVLFPYKVL